VEAAPERVEIKYQIFRDLDAAAPPGAILASNTSSISITEIAARTRRPDRVIGMHFMNPVPVMQLVEVIRGLATSDETMQAVMDLSRTLGKTPVEVNDFPGFVSNRVLMPMINEAVFALMEGVAEPVAIDTVMTLGMNHPLGPLALADLIGLDTCLNILEVLHRELGDDRYRPCPLLRKYVAAGWLGRKTGRGFHLYEGWGAGPMLTSEQMEIRGLARDFAAGQIRPESARWDASRVLPPSLRGKLAELGFYGMRVSEADGGVGLDRGTFLVALEELAWGDAAAALPVALHNCVVVGLLSDVGSPGQRAEWLPRLASGERLRA